MLLKHINNTDVAIEILKSFYVKNKEIYKCKVMWYRISTRYPPRCMYFVENIIIAKKDMPNWKPVE